MIKYTFHQAKAIWAIDRREEMNCELTFRAEVLKEKECSIALASSGVYRLWVNGIFVAAGPARTAHGFFRVDVIPIGSHLTKEKNIIVIEALGYCVNSYDTLDQPSFLTAEITAGSDVIAWTGGEQFQIYDLHQRIQKVQRYSFQRAFIDTYRLSPEMTAIYSQKMTSLTPELAEIQDQKQYISREVRMPHYEVLMPEEIQCAGTAIFDRQNQEIIPEENYFQISEVLKGYSRQETEFHVSEEVQRIQCIPDREERQSAPEKVENGFVMYRLPYDAVGFYNIEVKAETEGKIYILFDEIMSGGDIDFLRMYSCNSFYYEVQPGTYRLMNFTPYTMKYIKVIIKGKAMLGDVSFIEYKHPAMERRVRLPEQEKELNRIYDAAMKTFQSNSLDVFMDCPSRERGGWLCDSYFTSDVEYILTGKNVLEKAFLENFIMQDHFEHLPEGMLPMCYPADHNNGNFIPNWAMWYVLELEKFHQHNNDLELIGQAKGAVYRLIEYFHKFENEEGLLEDLKGWIFIEWSIANDEDLVQGVNFPSNMLYMRMLQAAGALYDDTNLLEKAEKLRLSIRMRSLLNGFYTDHEHRQRDGYVNPGVSTEVCQYYAFFTGTATVSEDKELWKILKRDFGPSRRKHNNYPDIAFTNAFIGNYLRVELLYRNGLYRDVLQNIKEYFLPMAMATGTLWEHELAIGSCNHGFASYVICWLAGIFGWEDKID